MESSNKLMSDNINELATALAKAQGEMPTAKKNSKNPFFKSMYADFESITEAITPSFSKYGLSYSQEIDEEENGNNYLITFILHSSGQWLKSRARIKPQKEDIQSFSSYITYLKRICLSASTGVATGEADDDGEAAIVRNEPSRTVNHYQQPLVEKISNDQLEQLENELDGYPEIKSKVVSALNLERLSDMPRPAFLKALNRIRELAQQEQELKKR